MTKVRAFKAPDKVLVRRYLDGDELAFEELWTRYRAKLAGTIFKIVHDVVVVEDVLQQVAIALVRKLRGYRGGAAFSSWLYRVAVNEALMWLRKNRRLLLSAWEEERETEIPHHPRLENFIDAQRRLRLVASSAQKIKSEYRHAWIVRDVWDFSNAEAAAMLQTTIPAVKSRLFRARNALQKRVANG